MSNEQKRTFPGQFESLAPIGEFVVEAAEAAGLDARSVYGVQLAVDEACTNIIEHAYGGEGHGEIECTCHIENAGLTVTLRDYGNPFDPANVAEPDIHAGLDERDSGGLGVYFMHKLLDEVRFEHTSQDGNILTLVKRRKET